MKLVLRGSCTKVSKEPFERPANLSIKVDCYVPKKVVDTTAVEKIQKSLNYKTNFLELIQLYVTIFLKAIKIAFKKYFHYKRSSLNSMTKGK
jgi:hypothetical protein